ncbi:MAG TPA: class I SAM-dependent methyltransferase, partial [Bryobacteraceae bacterium]|nr:class I SAM-dependent methyltransferase [Bryobacteraceae bacterium]
KFSAPAPVFNPNPSRLLVEAVRGRKPGSAVDLGMGQGRNAIWLAQQGWQTTGVDLSDVAVGQASARAHQSGLNLTAIIDSLDHFDMGRSRWDLIALFYMHAWYNGTRPLSTRRIVQSLKPGGLLVIEGFAGHDGLKGKDGFMFQRDELPRDFSGLKVLRYEDVETEADWSPGHKSHIIRFVAEKPRG